MDKNTKPRVFIGSSSERLEFAEAIQMNLEYDCHPKVWNQGVFKPSVDSISSLSAELNRTDFGIMILAPDDLMKIRNANVQSIRDNVIFELGLLIGKLGRERVFVVKPRESTNEENLSFHLPTDFIGLTPLTYDAERSQEDLQASLGPASSTIKKVLKQMGRIASAESTRHPVIESHTYTDEEQYGILLDWFEKKQSAEKHSLINCPDTDKLLKLPDGTTRKHIQRVAQHLDYEVVVNGPQLVKFKWVQRELQGADFLTGRRDGSPWL